MLRQERVPLSGPTAAAHLRGFSLVEVMVAVIVLCVGLLGIARMQSLALSSTTVASKRSLAALQAASLAGAMHENRGYWDSSDPAGATITVQGTTFSYVGAPLLTGAGTPNCAVPGTPCTPPSMAAYDLQQWATSVKALLPNDTATISCGTVTPVTCTINLTWTENAVAVNAQQAAAQKANPNANFENPSYTLYVEP